MLRPQPDLIEHPKARVTKSEILMQAVYPVALHRHQRQRRSRRSRSPGCRRSIHTAPRSVVRLNLKKFGNYTTQTQDCRSTAPPSDAPCSPCEGHPLATSLLGCSCFASSSGIPTNNLSFATSLLSRSCFASSSSIRVRMSPGRPTNSQSPHGSCTA